MFFIAITILSFFNKKAAAVENSIMAPSFECPVEFKRNYSSIAWWRRLRNSDIAPGIYIFPFTCQPIMSGKFDVFFAGCSDQNDRQNGNYLFHTRYNSQH